MSEVRLELDDPSSYKISGESINGKIILNVVKDKLSVKDIKLRIICEVEASLTVNTARPEKTPKMKVHRSNARLFDIDNNVYPDHHHFAVGSHEIPFSVPLPDNDPTFPPSAISVLQPNTFGHVNYRLKAHVKKGVSSWFQSNELKTDSAFLFMPVSYINKSDPSPVLRDEPFNQYLDGGLRPQKGFMASLLRMKPKQELPLEIKGIFSHPQDGIIQGKSAPLKLIIQTGVPGETIVVNSLAIHLESVLLLRNQGSYLSHVIKSDPLLQERLLKSGERIDLTDTISRNHVPKTLTPSFDTDPLCYRHRICIEVIVSRHSGSNQLKFIHRIPVKVLSPFLKDPNETSTTPAEPVVGFNEKEQLKQTMQSAQLPEDKSDSKYSEPLPVQHQQQSYIKPEKMVQHPIPRKPAPKHSETLPLVSQSSTSGQNSAPQSQPEQPQLHSIPPQPPVNTESHADSSDAPTEPPPDYKEAMNN